MPLVLAAFLVVFATVSMRTVEARNGLARNR
jgi:hypothetical protein